MGQFVARKMQVEQWFSDIYARDMAKNCPRYIPDMPEIRASFAQGMGIQIEKVVQNVARFVPFLANLAPFYPCF